MTARRLGKAESEFDEVRFRDLWHQGIRRIDIAVAFNMDSRTVSKRARSLGLKSRDFAGRPISEAVPTKTTGLQRETGDAPLLDPRGPFNADIDQAIFETGGTYVKLAALSAKHNILFTAIQQRSHMLRAAKPQKERA